MTATPVKLDLSAPHQKYVLADGTETVGVTTILGVLGKDALLPWAASEERKMLVGLWASGADPGAVPERYAFQTNVGKAQDLGTVTHARIEAWLKHGSDCLSPEGLDAEVYAQSVFGFDRFREWWDAEKLTLVASEEQMVSETHRYGGTLDVVAARTDGTLLLLDIKTSKPNRRWPWPTVVAQVAAYAWLWNENAPSRIGVVSVFRVGKERGDGGQVVAVSEARREVGWRLFLAAKDAHRALRQLEAWKS